jgi:hypothetical protein
MKQSPLDTFAEKHSIDFEANAARQLNDMDMAPVQPWAQEYALMAPVFHVTTLDSADNIVRSGEAIKSHRRLHPQRNAFVAVENTKGRTAELDVVHGFDEFVFASMGKLATAGADSFIAFELNQDVLDTSVASLRDVAAMHAIVLCPEEQFNEDAADQAKVQRENDAIVHEFLGELTYANRFADVFAAYLARDFSSEHDFLETFSFRKGVVDLPPQGSAAYDELAAMVKMFRQFPGIESFDYFKHGHYYAGPQVMIPNEVPTELIDGVVFYEGAQADSLDALAVLRRAEKRGMYAEVITARDVASYMAGAYAMSMLQTASEFSIATRTALNVLVNQRLGVLAAK